MTSQPDQTAQSPVPILLQLEILKGPFAAEEAIASISTRVLGTTKPEELEEALRALIAGLAVALPNTTARKREEEEDYRLVLSIGDYWAQKRLHTQRLVHIQFTARDVVLLALREMIAAAMRFYEATGSWRSDPALLTFSTLPA